MPDDGNARFLGGVAGNAGLFGTVAGVLGMARAWLEPGLLLTADEIALATADRTAGLGQARGLGWQLAATPGCSAGSALSPSSFGHTGFAGASLWVDPTRGTALALLGNRVHPAHRPTDLHPLRRRFHRIVIDRLG
jgi:CubicO group peptidase (beta-lactamase class C family)